MNDPTIKLRWIEAELNDNTPVAMLPNYPECGNSYFKLQQQVNGEWVDIVIEWIPDNLQT